MKKWNNAELIALNINSTENGPKHGPKEIETSNNSTKWHHEPGTDQDCNECLSMTTDDHDDIVNHES